MKDTSDMLNSESPRSWLIMGMNLLYKFNQNHVALVCFEKSLDLDPENLLVYQYKASALRAIGKNSEALVFSFSRNDISDSTLRFNNIVLSTRNYVNMTVHYCLPRIFSNVYSNIKSSNCFVFFNNFLFYLF